MSDKDRKEKLWDADLAAIMDIEKEMGDVGTPFIMRKLKVSTLYALQLKKEIQDLKYSVQHEIRPSA